jgi:site-specific recombinase XerC
MCIFFSVILSEAKDLIAACHWHEILRFAQDDNGKHPEPATSISAIKVSSRLPPTLIGVSLAEIAEIPTRDGLSLRRRAAMVLGSQPNVQLAINGGDDGG